MSIEMAVAVVALTGTMSGVLATLVASLLAARTAREQRRWDTLWAKKAATYEELLRWSNGEKRLSADEAWVQAALHGSQEVLNVLETFAKEHEDSGSEQRMKDGLVREIREDLRTAKRLPD